MSKTRNNHYVPQWYQEGFFEIGRNTLAYLDMKPEQRTLDSGRVVSERNLFDAPTSRAFRQTDLYSTFFGTSVDDEIERRLFGNIDGNGSKAVRAFIDLDVSGWHRHFQTFFEYIDTQKIRTPKGLDWLKAQYPKLSQNELMFEMQGIRMMHCTIWSEGVREIVSAEDSDVKFILSDHPVTIYNHAAPTDARTCAYPHDASIALKGSQTIFPLNRNFCLILTNLEYAKDPSTNSLDKRTFARNFRSSMVRTDAFARSRRLSSHEVSRINYVLKSRARRYIAAGRIEWLYPEKTITEQWGDFRETFLPPEDALWNFGGEMYARFESGAVHYQDEFGRTEKQRDFLKKELPAQPLRATDSCGCGSGRTFKTCCQSKALQVRPTWTEVSIRERNCMLLNGIVNVLGLGKEKDWVAIRRELTDEKIGKIYSLYEALWPRETDLLELLPKPDGTPRAVYTGSIHPSAITDFAIGASIYFGEILIEHPFLHAGTVKKEFSPVEHPRMYRQEFLKTVAFFLKLMPLVEIGTIHLVPDPCNFDRHLCDQMFRMAEARSGDFQRSQKKDLRLEQLMKEDFQRSIMSLPEDSLRIQLKKSSPDLSATDIEKNLTAIERMKEHDPLAVLQEGNIVAGKKKGNSRSQNWLRILR